LASSPQSSVIIFIAIGRAHLHLFQYVFRNNELIFRSVSGKLV
jgi:hypothetical protein